MYVKVKLIVELNFDFNFWTRLEYSNLMIRLDLNIRI